MHHANCCEELIITTLKIHFEENAGINASVVSRASGFERLALIQEQLMVCQVRTFNIHEFN